MRKNKVGPSIHYSRKDWLKTVSILVSGLALLPKLPKAMPHDKAAAYQYHIATVRAIRSLLPPNKTIPFDWPVAELPPNGNEVLLGWEKKLNIASPKIFFRLTSATDIREECTLELSLPVSKQTIGLMDIRFSHYMQPYELAIENDFLAKIWVEGIAIKMVRGTKPFWFFINADEKKEVPESFLPSLLVSNSLEDGYAWKDRLLSLASISSFGWMEGCVLDGISMMAANDKKAKKILQQHLDKFFAADQLVYEAFNNERWTNKILNVETVLPFAMLAAQNPQHFMLQKTIDYCMEHADAAGVIADELGANRRLKTEECYTISYPLAILSKKLNRPGLEQMAIANLQARVKLLSNEDFIFQNSKELEPPGMANWARGVGWYMLGLAKTLAILEKNEVTEPLLVALQNAAALVVKYQQPNGLWNCFLHEPETGIETSGSASIAAALAYGYSKKMLPIACRSAAEKCQQGLKSYLTPDGFLKGTAQVNKGGLLLQRNGFRVISPYTLGFLGILETSLLAKSISMQNSNTD